MDNLNVVVAEIEKIIYDVKEIWRANNGGLTWAATDVLSTGYSILKKIDERDHKWLEKCDPFSGSTGDESDLFSLANQAAVILKSFRI